MEQFEARAIGARIAQTRLERGLTQEQLAEMSSFSKRSLTDYETGATIPYRHFRELSRILGKPVEWFLHGDDEEPAVTSQPEANAELLAEVREVASEVREIRERLQRIEGRLPRPASEQAADGQG